MDQTDRPLRESRTFSILAEQLQYLQAHVWNCDRPSVACPTCSRFRQAMEAARSTLLEIFHS